MSEPDDLFQKADALLGRYRNDLKAEADFPTLTEVVETLPAPLPADVPAEAPAPLDAGPAPPTPADTGPDALRAALTQRLEADLELLVSAAIEAGRSQFEDELRLAAHRLLADAETEVIERLRERLAEAVRQAVDSLQRG